jgi:hypothetical protein
MDIENGKRRQSEGEKLAGAVSGHFEFIIKRFIRGFAFGGVTVLLIIAGFENRFTVMTAFLICVGWAALRQNHSPLLRKQDLSMVDVWFGAKAAWYFGTVVVSNIRTSLNGAVFESGSGGCFRSVKNGFKESCACVVYLISAHVEHDVAPQHAGA